MSEQELVQIRGTVDEVIFQNESTGFAVIELDTGEELVCAVGELTGVSTGETLTLTGCYTAHPKFGYQFKVSVFERSLPETAEARYLRMAARILERLMKVSFTSSFMIRSTYLWR